MYDHSSNFTAIPPDRCILSVVMVVYDRYWPFVHISERMKRSMSCEGLKTVSSPVMLFPAHEVAPVIIVVCQAGVRHNWFSRLLSYSHTLLLFRYPPATVIPPRLAYPIVVKVYRLVDATIGRSETKLNKKVSEIPISFCWLPQPSSLSVGLTMTSSCVDPSSSSLTFTNIMGQGRVNQLGKRYIYRTMYIYMQAVYLSTVVHYRMLYVCV